MTVTPARRSRSVVLVQFRHTGAAIEQEQACFLRAGSLRREELVTRNVVTGDALVWDDVAEADAVVLGGAGEHSVIEHPECIDAVAPVVERLIDESRPVFGSCFGHHLLAVLTGGEVVTDRAREEVGSFHVWLTEDGKDDPVFGPLPFRFSVQLGHHDRVASIGEGVVELAASDRCCYQAFRIEGRPVYSTQFHPEMTVEDLRHRLRMYKESYLPGKGDFEAFVAALRPSTEAYTLIQRFLDRYA